MAFSYDNTLSTPKDKVRFYIQDTKSDNYFFEDEEVEGLLAIHSNNLNTTIIDCCYVLAALFSAEADSESTGPYSVSYKSLADKYIKIAQTFRQKAYRTLSCYAGGISRRDMQTSQLDADIIQPAFARNMMKNRRTYSKLTQREETL